jgi:hypothetical protein
MLFDENTLRPSPCTQSSRNEFLGCLRKNQAKTWMLSRLRPAHPFTCNATDVSFVKRERDGCVTVMREGYIQARCIGPQKCGGKLSGKARLSLMDALRLAFFNDRNVMSPPDNSKNEAALLLLLRNK